MKVWCQLHVPAYKYDKITLWYQLHMRVQGGCLEANHCPSDVLLAVWSLYPSRYQGSVTFKTPDKF